MYRFHTTHLPLQIIEVAGQLDDADLQRMEDGLRWSVAAGQPYVSLTLARYAERPSSSERKRIAELTDMGKSNTWCKAVAIVVGNELVAGALTAIRWISPSPRPERSFTDVGDALRWLEPHAASAGLAISEAARIEARRLDSVRPG